MWGAIKYALANLANPRGRDARQTFWYWVLAVFILRVVAGWLVSIPMTLKIMSAAMQTARSGVNGNAPPDPSAMMAIVANDMPNMAYYTIAIGILSVLLVWASLVRRLHDSNLSGWVALVPAGLYAVALVRLPHEIQAAADVIRTMPHGSVPNPAAMMRAQGPMVLFAWVPLVLVIVIGVRKSTDGPNRYGDAPVQF